MLQKLHKVHFGMEKTKARARRIFYWPRMTTDIEKYIEECLKYSRANMKEPLIPHERPNIPFAKIGSDVLEWNFNICTSSPRYPKSNGLAERAVGICKGMLRKCDEAGVDIELALLEYRTTNVMKLELT
ncbi:Integrase zinc binding domain [Popillia japonica]|uniref:RNA-directed DNA polymerase n=1 Tax=Popillia japonica TaxID=7064 RepID=A0AAW1MDY3_POPJA